MACGSSQYTFVGALLLSCVVLMRHAELVDLLMLNSCHVLAFLALFYSHILAETRGPQFTVCFKLKLAALNSCRPRLPTRSVITCKAWRAMMWPLAYIFDCHGCPNSDLSRVKFLEAEILPCSPCCACWQRKLTPYPDFWHQSTRHSCLNVYSSEYRDLRWRFMLIAPWAY